ncbi:MAG: CHASE3 domain-containing protein [Nostoc sp. ChiSLP02]|nr:CHASE3 domain-containing protein [Nostoc sp. DedSLP05]MDZ8103268.1 CHASE3 domain-containing protein [Nostoc sp. DedSLP01]MDZ8187715.1 CHASE3 domain-containing protein [Nostoc sp. ChiSLP02]
MLNIAETLFRRKIIRTIGLPILLLLSLSGISIWQIYRLLSVMSWVEHTDQVIAQAYLTQKLLLDLETGVRGYQLTGNWEFLQPYRQSSSQINTAFDKLANLVVDNPIQTQRLKVIRFHETNWNNLISQALARKERGEVEPIGGFKIRKRIMDEMRTEIAKLIDTEEQLRTQRTQAVQATTMQVIAISIILAIVFGIFLAYFISRQVFQVSQTYQSALITAQQEAENAQQQAQQAQRAAQRLAALHNIDRAILRSESIESLISNALTEMRQILPYQQAFVAVFDFETSTSKIIAGSINNGELQPPIGTQMSFTEFATNTTELENIRYTPDLAIAQSYPPILAQLHSQGMRCSLAIPMFAEETLFGELNLSTTVADAFNQEAHNIAFEVTAQLAIAIQQSLLREQLQSYANELEERVVERTAQLQETNQELEAFTYTISHDLRAPLRTMQGFAQALEEDYTDKFDSVGQQYIQFITEGAIQMDTLIADLLAYSRLSRAQIQMQKVDLTSVVEEALKQLTAQLQEQQAQVTVKKPLPLVMAHRPTLVQVLINLLNNAIKFVRSGIQPKIQIYAQEHQNSIQLSIVDNGIGIAPQHQERIFRVFERLHGVEIYPGTGIGLAIVRKGLERMNGRAGVESQLGAGSRFWIALPKAVLHSNDSDDASTPDFDN